MWHKAFRLKTGRPPGLSIITGGGIARGLLGGAHEPTAAERAAQAARDAAYEAARCPQCGCHPDEHGAC